MSYAVKRPAAMTTTSTATVVEYVCLFTHDLRRKQKRWQDGKLKLHTFNNRVMVHDERGNVIGDSHLPLGGVEELAEGDEIHLDRGAAIVQVGNCTGHWEQDLSEVVDRRIKNVEERRTAAVAKTRRAPGGTDSPVASLTTPGPKSVVARLPPPMTPTVGQSQRRDHFQLHHRPLSSIVTGSGPPGRAVLPDRSPYEMRLAKEAQKPQNGIPEVSVAKRRRVDVSPPSKAGYAQNLFGTRLTLSSNGPTSTQSRARMEPLLTVSNVGKEKMGERVREREELGEISRNSLPQVEPLLKERLKRNEKRPMPAELTGNSEAAVTNGASGQTNHRFQRHSSPVVISSDGEAQDSRLPAHENDKSVSRAPSKPRTLILTGSHERSRVLTDHTSKRVVKRSESKTGPLTAGVEPISDQKQTLAPNRGPELRTELRIKARPRRGLLLVSERIQKALKRRTLASDDVSRQNDRPDGLHNQKDALDISHYNATNEKLTGKNSNASRSVSNTQPRGTDESRIMDDDQHEAISLAQESTSESDVACPRRRRRGNALLRNPEQQGQTRKEKRHAIRDFDASSDELESPPEMCSGRRLRPKRSGLGKSQPKDKPETTGPRVVRLGRRSVKSKEMIGFEFPTEANIVPVAFAAGTNRIGGTGNDEQYTPVPARDRSVGTVAPATEVQSDHTSSGAGSAEERQTSMPSKIIDETTYDHTTLTPIVVPGKPEILNESITAARPQIDGQVAQTSHRPMGTRRDSPGGEYKAELASTASRHQDATLVTFPSLTGTDDMSAVETSRNQGQHDGNARRTGTSTNAGKRPSLANPATRGRKAAHKDDAAGQAPQVLVQLERATTSAMPLQKDGNTMPGFSKANGGAWSKHAEDLLGMARPARDSTGLQC